MISHECPRVRRELSAYLDGELPVPLHMHVRQHLWACPSCRSEFEAFASVGSVLRGRPPVDHLVNVPGFTDAIVSRVTAEEHESWPSRVRRAFEDMHLVWAGLSATAAVCVCAISLVALWYFSPPERCGEFFGLWGVATRLASILGPVTYGAVTWATGGNHRLAILVTGVFFVFAIACLAAVNERRGHAAAFPPKSP